MGAPTEVYFRESALCFLRWGEESLPEDPLSPAVWTEIVKTKPWEPETARASLRTALLLRVLGGHEFRQGHIADLFHNRLTPLADHEIDDHFDAARGLVVDHQQQRPT